MIREIKYIDGNGKEGIGEFELFELSDKVRLVFHNSNLELDKEADNYFDALAEIRIELESKGNSVLCNGSSLNVYPSGLSLNMGNGIKAYRLKTGFHASIQDIVDIFDYEPENFIESTVDEQKEFFDKWNKSKRRNKYLKPKYSLDLITKDNVDEFIYFWGHQPSRSGNITKSCFSQWWECEFEYDGIVYNSSEQWMMAEKARAFLDKDRLNKILKSKSPKEAKQFGREVSNFNEDVWNMKNYSIVVKGNYLKFSQNPELRDYLLSTGDSILVEASPYDNIWGIGMKQDDKGIENPKNWKGKNLLGFALMEVRDELKKQFSKPIV